MKRSTIVTALATLVGAGILATVAGIAVVASGLASVSAIPPHGAITTALLHFTFKRAVSHGAADYAAPEDLFAEGRIALGAKHYADECSKCHGGPELGQNPVALSMRPRPQHLVEVVDQFTDPELFWILKNGVKFSAMPSWPSARRDDEIWSVVAFIRQLPKMTSAQYIALVTPPEGDLPGVPYGPAVAAKATIVPPQSGPVDEYAYASPSTEWRDLALGGLPLQTCVNCHGVEGTGAPTKGEAPNLSIQSVGYLRDALGAYAHRQRHSGFMEPLASDLSPTQIDGLAAYFAGRPASASPAVAADPAQIAAGEAIALNGVPERGLPGCLSCHEKRAKDADGDAPIRIPHLYGQSQVYIARQLDAFANSDRGSGGAYNPMPAEASGLTVEERHAVAAWFAAQAPGRVVAVPTPPVDLAAAQGIVGQVCTKCHGADGLGSTSGEFPNLTLQTPDYLALSLHAFRMNARHASKMNETAKRLSDTDISSLAAYFGGMTPVSTGGTGDAAAVARGKAIAEGGIADRGVPACVTCHGAASTAEVPIIARLNGQHPEYLRTKLDYFAGTTADQVSGFNPMPAIASRLTEAERADVVAWFASLDPLPKALVPIP